ncbi:MAG: glycosyl transferase family 1 [Phycisphaerae bacterium]|nr:glycosyl transferase family 1 [Phycisphaerae bacterium]|tara:strand:- start:185 stop:1339 length:1155 start_codon:yes stop_codon:yes gene_type:complete
MKIMHVSTRLIIGGSQENTVLSCMGQSDAGHEVSLVYGPIHGPEGSMLPEVEAHGGIEAIETKNMVRQIAPIRDFRCLRDLTRLIRKMRPDVVHTHSSKAGILGRHAARRAGTPAIVHTIHGLPFHPYQSQLKNRIFIDLESRAAKRCDAIVCVAEAMRIQALEQGIGTPEQYITIRSGMDTKSFLRERSDREEWRTRFGFTPDDFVVGTVARLAELKGHDDLLDALGEDLKSDRRLKLLWVGDGFHGERIRARIRTLGLQDSIVEAGRCDPEDIPAIMHSIDLLAHPSWREGLPRTVPQALLSGTPVVAHDVDGTGEVVIEGRTGRLVSPGDHLRLRKTILDARWNPEIEKELAENGRRLCKDMFSSEKMVSELEKLYESLLD